MNLFFKECNQLRKSLVYILFVFVVIIFYVSQFGSKISENLEIMQGYKDTDYSTYTGYDRRIPTAIKPVEGSIEYGTKIKEVPEQIMQMGIDSIMSEYIYESYSTYPIMFYKNVKLNDEEQAQIGLYIEEITGITDVMEFFDTKYITADKDNVGNNVVLDNYGQNPDYEIPILVSYERFNVIMSEICDILGGGSKYEPENLKRESGVPMTYEEKMQEYNDFVFTDKVTGAYARLFVDYMGLAVAMFSIFVSVSFLLRDKKSRMAELVYSRKASSTKIILSKYFAVVFMIMLPVLLLSIYPTIQCFGFEEFIPNVEISIFAFAKYIIAWVLPTVMAITALSFILTVAIDTPIAIIAGIAWVFVDIGSSIVRMQGGNYGAELVVRHNTVGNLQNMQNEIELLILNRISYAVVSIIVVIVTIYIYELKRKGKVNLGGKLQKISIHNKGTNKTKPSI